MANPTGKNQYNSRSQKMAKNIAQSSDYNRVIHGVMKMDDYHKKYGLGKHKPSGNISNMMGGLYKNLVKTAASGKK